MDVVNHNTSCLRDAKSSNVDESDQFDAELDALVSQLSHFDWKADVIEASGKMLASDDLTENYNGVIRFKKLLCVVRQQVLQVAEDVVKSGVLPRLVHFVSTSNDYDLQLASTFCLTNIAAGDDGETEAVVQANAIPVLMKLLKSDYPQLRRQAIFCLANIAGSTPQNRFILAAEPDYCKNVLQSAAECEDSNIECIAAWNIRNMAVLPGTPLVALADAVTYFAHVVNSRPRDADIEKYALESLATICSTPDGRCLVLDHSCEVVPNCCDLIDSGSDENKLMAMDVIFEIANGSFCAKDAILFTGGEFALTRILEENSNSHRIRLRALECLRALSKGECAGHASRLLTAGCFPRRNGRMAQTEGNFASSVFGSLSTATDRMSAVDVCIDICYQRTSEEDPALRQGAALLVCNVASTAHVETLINWPRIEELIPLIIEVIEHEAAVDIRASVSRCGDMAQAVRSDHNGSELGKVPHGAEDPSANIITALGAMEKVVAVGERIAVLRGLESNPVVLLYEQLGAASRLGDVLRQTCNCDVSRKLVNILHCCFNYLPLQ